MERKRILMAAKALEDVQDLRSFLISSGYEVKIVNDGAAALTLCREFKPHLMLSDIYLPKIDGHHLLRELKSQSATKHIPFVLMSRHRSVEERVHSINLGVDDYISTPFDAKEIALRFEIILKETEKFEAVSNRNLKGFSGKLSELNLVELVQTVEISRKSGTVKIQNDNQEGIVFFKEGEILDANLGDLNAQDAIFRMFTWNDGTFQVAIRDIDQTKVLTTSTKELINQGLLYKDRWDKLTKNLPPLLAMVRPSPIITDNNLTADEMSIINLMTTNTRLIDLIETSQLNDSIALKIIVSLFKRGYIVEVQTDGSIDKVESLKKNHIVKGDGKESYIAKLIQNFINQREQSRNIFKTERRKGERRRAERRRRYRRWSDLVHDDMQIFLNKSELLMIREKLANGHNGNKPST